MSSKLYVLLFLISSLYNNSFGIFNNQINKKKIFLMFVFMQQEARQLSPQSPRPPAAP
jgi:hypothetical protein